MALNSSDRSEKGNSGILRTTTWGTLIAFSLILTVLGFTGHSFRGSRKLYKFAGNRSATPTLTP